MPSAAGSRHAAHTVPGRNPRRRTRQEIDGSTSLRQTRHSKRSKLDNGSFVPVESNGHLETVPSEPYMNGHAINGDARDASPAVASTEQLTSKDTRKNTRGTHRSNGARDESIHALTKSEVYQAVRLPNVPEELQEAGINFQGSTLASESLALAVTRDRAYIWSYAHATSPRVFSLPYPAKESEPLPVAAIVKNGSSSDTGLVVVSARSGRVTFWENIENAAALSLFEQKRNGTEGSLGSMLSNEVVTDIEHADPVGFVLTLSSGRVAQLSLWDSQSRPSITVRFLKSDRANTGYFGGLWNALGVGGFLRDVAAVRSHLSKARGLAEVIVASEKAVFQLWQLSWSNRPSLRNEINAGESMEAAIKDALQSTLPSQIQSTSLLDCIISSSATGSSDKTFRLVCLISAQGADFKTYALMEMSLSDSGLIECSEVYPLDSYAAPLTGSARWRPHLCFPTQSSTIFVLFEKAVTIFSRAGKPFQDTVYLKDDEDVSVMSVSAEIFDERRREASATVYIRSFGSVRVTAFESALENDEEGMSARTNIEQAVFFGTKARNPFNLGRGHHLQHPLSEVAAAAKAVSRDIISSRYNSSSPLLPSMEADLQRRSNALEDLAKHMKHVHSQVSRSTKWELLWDAEKLAAARKIWSDYDRSRGRRSKAVRLLPELIDYLHPDHKAPATEKDDALRYYFHHDIERLQHLLPITYQAVYHLTRRSDVRGKEAFYQLVCDGGDFINGVLQTAFDFRQKNAWLYGLGDEIIEDGILTSPADYRELPQFWTSNFAAVTKIREFILNAQEAVISSPENPEFGKSIDPALVLKIAVDNPALISAWSQSFEERYRWTQAREDAQAVKDGQTEHQQWIDARTQMLGNLTELSQYAPGTILAEKYNDMLALTLLLRHEAAMLTEEYRKGSTSAERTTRDSHTPTFQDRIGSLEARVRTFCEKYGRHFTHPYFSEFVRGGTPSALLDMSTSYRAELTEYLRSDANRRKLSWINDVLVERDYTAGAEALTNLSIREPTARNKKISLSVSKLALIAAEEAEPTGMSNATYRKAVASNLVLSQIQWGLSEHVKPILSNAVDQDALFEMLMDEFGSKVPDQARPALWQLLQRGLENLTTGATMGVEELVDILTLMDARDLQDDEYIDYNARDQFGMALRLLHAASEEQDADQSRLDMARQITWRRAYIEDDWVDITNTVQKSDAEVEEALATTVLFKTFTYCFTHGLLSESEPPPSRHEVLLAGTQPEDLMQRFGSQDLAEPIARDMGPEETELRTLLDSHDLERWINATRELAIRLSSEERQYTLSYSAELKEYARAQLDVESGKIWSSDAEGAMAGIVVEGEK